MLYRDILRKPQLLDIKDKDGFISILKKAIVFNVDNIAEYLHSISEQHYWDMTVDFPNLAPPFPLFWMEYTPPQLQNVDGEIRKNKATWPIGVLIHGLQPNDFPTVSPLNNDHRWILNLDLFLKSPSKVIHTSTSIVLIDKNGNVIKTDDGKAMWGKKVPIDLIKRLSSVGYDANSIDAELFPVLLAISFLHCKNVTMIETGRVKRQYHCKNKNREPETKIHTLEIEPMKKVLKTEGKSEETGLKRALHICRGHFKDFREKGLFGKFKDIYWWDSQVRGSSKYGTINKDYNVNPPQEG